MKKETESELDDELRPEYDLSKLLKNGVRGKYAERYKAGTNLAEIMNLWAEIAKLEGKTLKTLNRSRLFDVVEVNAQEVIVKPRVRGIERTIHREAIEGAFKELVMRGEIARTDIRDRYSDFNPAYVVAILAALPSVKVVSRNPI